MRTRFALAALTAALTAGLLVASLATGVGSAGASTTSASTGIFAPLDRPGPALSVPTATLAAALSCHGNPATSNGEPVLLSPATGVTPEQNYSWNYERDFTAQGRAWCALTMPYHTLGDIQIAGEYLVYGIRTLYAAAHRRIAVMGHSQGGMSMRWALRFWPDTRTMVDDVIGMAGSNHGSTSVGFCVPNLIACPPAVWQQGAHANFITALNSGAETFAGISYTEIFTHHDEVVTPNNTDADSSSALHTGDGMIANIATQDICPGDPSEHLLVGTTDPVTYALVMDALDHAGPADPSRINRSVCSQLLQPGVDALDPQTYVQVAAALPGLAAVDVPGVNLVGAPEVKQEPALDCYVYASGC